MKKKNIFLYFVAARDHEINITKNVLKGITEKSIQNNKCLQSLVYKEIIKEERFLLYEKWQISQQEAEKLIRNETLNLLIEQLLAKNILRSAIWNELYTTKGFDKIDNKHNGIVSITEAAIKCNAITGLFELFEMFLGYIHEYKGFLGCSLSIPNEGELEKVLLKVIWTNLEMREKSVSSKSFQNLRVKLQKYVTGNLETMLFEEIE